MKCPHCHDTVRCANCGGRVLSSQARWARKRAKDGFCARCPQKVNETDRKRGHIHCRTCRRAQAERSRVRHAKHGRKDRKAAA